MTMPESYFGIVEITSRSPHRAHDRIVSTRFLCRSSEFDQKKEGISRQIFGDLLKVVEPGFKVLPQGPIHVGLGGGEENHESKNCRDRYSKDCYDSENHGTSVRKRNSCTLLFSKHRSCQ
jgi:hypothetical protein